MVGKSLQDLLLSLPATMHTPRLPYRASYKGCRKNVVPADAGCALYSWDWGETPPQPCQELQLPCQQSTLDGGALWQSHPDPLTVGKPTAEFTAVR
jgi:hypothetical protein